MRRRPSPSILVTLAWRRLIAFARTLSRRAALDRELDDELRTYLDDRTERLIRQGIDPREARRVVLADEGGIEPVKELTRDARVGAWALTVVQDVRVGIRMLRRAPGFGVVACLTMALGVGASVAVLTVMRSVLWRPLPYPDAERLVVVEADVRGVANAGLTEAEIQTLRAGSRTLERVSMANGVEAHVDAGGGDVERVGAASVSDDLLPALGASAVHGRLLEARRDDADRANGVVISDDLWRRHLGADPAVIGRVITINNRPREIVGVLAPGFRAYLPESVGTLEHTDVWFSTTIRDDPKYRDIGVVARLTEGHSLTDAQRELDAIAARLMAERPALYAGAALGLRVRGVRQALTARVTSGLNALAWAVAFVLVLSCVNLATVLLARGAARTRELLVRRALGATRARLARQLVTESLLLTGAGSLIGIVAARWTIDAVVWLRPAHLPRQSHIAMDATVVLAAVAVAIVAGIAVGVLPALRLSRREDAAPGSARGDTAAPPLRRLQRLLFVAEIALSIVPLVAAGLMLRSFVNLVHAPTGMQPERVLTVWFPISLRQFEDVDARWRLHREATARLAALPGVEAASAVSPVPFGPREFIRRYGPAGGSAPLAQASQHIVLPGFFDVAGVRLTQGRDFHDDDLRERRRVVIIDARMAQSLWPDGALGQRLSVASDASVTELEVIGVTAPVRTRAVGESRLPPMFLPYTLSPVEMALAIRTHADHTALAPDIRRTLASFGTGRAIEVRPLADFARDSMAETRFVLLLLGVFAGAAVVLAAVGLYGTVAYLTSQRTREFGVRLALGASPRQILVDVAGHGLRLAAAGVGLGLVGAVAAAQTLRRLLYGVEPVDATTLIAVAGAALVVALFACLRPAWRASRISAVQALQ